MRQFPQHESGGNNSFHLKKLLGGLYELIHETSFEKGLAFRKPLINVHYYHLKTSIFPFYHFWSKWNLDFDGQKYLQQHEYYEHSVRHMASI